MGSGYLDVWGTVAFILSGSMASNLLFSSLRPTPDLIYYIGDSLSTFLEQYIQQHIFLKKSAFQWKIYNHKTNFRLQWVPENVEWEDDNKTNLSVFIVLPGQLAPIFNF